MSLIVSEVLTEVKSVYLNDSAGKTWTNAKLLPYVKKAYSDLQRKLLKKGFVDLDEISAVLSVPANTVSMSAASILPSDFVQPIDLEERLDSSDSWHSMNQVDWEPSDNLPHDWLECWIFREGDIKFRGADRALQVKLKYRKSLSDIADENSLIPLTNAKDFLSARTGMLAAGFGGANLTRATALGTLADEAFDEISLIKVKDNQVVIRRKPYGNARRIRRGW